MEKTKIRFFMTMVLLITIGCFFINPQLLSAQKLTHTVKKGDTLWDICETYYGDPNLWPKLWQMNGFITNPHLLIPGDIVTLFEKENIAEETPVDEIIEEPPPAEEIKPKVMGINIEGLAMSDALGFLSLDKISSWGILFASIEKKIILGNNDIAYVLFEEDKTIKIGDIFSIGRSSSLLEDPLTGDDLGYVFSITGKLIIEERLGLAHKDNEFYQKKNVFKAKITDAYEPIYINDSLMPYKPMSHCVLPRSVNREILANIVAANAQQKLIHPGSIVYINVGANEGVRRGNLFEVAEGNIVRDPKPGKTVFDIYKSNIILPDNPLGRILVLDTRPYTATAIVLSASKSLSIGAYIKEISWNEKPDFLMTIASCPVE